VRSIKEECLDRLIPLGERHLRTAIAGVRRALPRRTESPMDWQLPDLRPAGYRHDASCATSSAARRTPQLLSASRGTVRSAAEWNSTGAPRVA
jgi:hypothetical protein